MRRDRVVVRRGSTRARGALVLLVVAAAMAACAAAAGDTHFGAAASRRAAVGPRPQGKRLGQGARRLRSRPVHCDLDGSPGHNGELLRRHNHSGAGARGRDPLPDPGGQGASREARAAPAYRYGPYPVIVFAHGYAVDPNTYRALLVSWVAAGYVVVAPFFPDTSLAAIEAQHGVDTEYDIFNQPGDVAFVVSQLVGQRTGRLPRTRPILSAWWMPTTCSRRPVRRRRHRCRAHVRPRYAGARSSLAARPVAVALLSGAEWNRTGDAYSAGHRGPAALVVQSLTDSCNDPADSSRLYNMLVSPKWFLALEDATHLGPYIGDGPAADVVERTTVGFFDLVVGRGNLTRWVLGQRGPPARSEHDLERTERAAVSGPALYAGRLRRAGGSTDGLTGTERDAVAYLDHAATTPMCPEAVAAMVPFLADTFGNPSGSHRVARTRRGGRLRTPARLSPAWSGHVLRHRVHQRRNRGGQPGLGGRCDRSGDGALQRRRASCVLEAAFSVAAVSSLSIAGGSSTSTISRACSTRACASSR